MSSLFLPISLACILPLGLAATEPVLPWYAALRTADAPVLDGELNDVCWSQAETTAPFVAMGGAALTVRTTGRLCWDEWKLYIALVCEEPNMARIETRIANNQIGAFEESIEVFLDPANARGSFVQFLLGITGERRSVKGGVHSAELQEGWTAKVKRSADRWVAELAISLTVLTDSPLTADRVWAMNLNRTCRPEPGRLPYHCWSPTKVAFAEPDRFGNLVFAPYPIWLRARYTSVTARVTAEIADLMMRYPCASEPLRPGLAELDAAWMDFLKTIEPVDNNHRDGRDALRQRAEAVVTRQTAFLDRLRLAVVETQFR